MITNLGSVGQLVVIHAEFAKLKFMLLFSSQLAINIIFMS